MYRTRKPSKRKKKKQVPRGHAVAGRPVRPPFPRGLRVQQGGQLGAETRRHGEARAGDSEQCRGDDLGAARGLGSAGLVTAGSWLVFSVGEQLVGSEAPGVVVAFQHQ